MSLSNTVSDVDPQLPSQVTSKKHGDQLLDGNSSSNATRTHSSYTPQIIISLDETEVWGPEIDAVLPKIASAKASGADVVAVAASKDLTLEKEAITGPRAAFIESLIKQSPLPIRVTDGKTIIETGGNGFQQRQIVDSVPAGKDGQGRGRYEVRTSAANAREALEILRKARDSSDDITVNVEGEHGLMTRALAGKFGLSHTFGVRSKRVAGETTVQQLLEVYRVKQQTPSTKIFGIVGRPVAHDHGFVLHNKFFSSSGVDAVYVAILVEDMAAFLDCVSAPDFGGFSVTMPHKTNALALAQHIDPIARDCGAANTLVAHAADGSTGEWSAHNTDWLGAVGAIEAGLEGRDLTNSYARAACAGSAAGGSGDDGRTSPLAGKTLIVVGVGGAGSAIAFGATHAGAKVMVADLDAAKAEALAKRLGAKAVPMDDVSAGKVKADVLANATPMGMMPNVTTTAVPPKTLGNFKAVFDAVYTPVKTQLLKDAEAAGCATMSGLDMFMGQAAEQFRLFTGGKEPPAAAEMRKYIVDYIASITKEP